MKTNVTEIINKIRNKEKVKGVYLYGTYGIGKTYRLKEISKQLYLFQEIGELKDKIKIAISNIFVAWPEYISAYKEKLNSSGNLTYSIDELKYTTVLFIDDLGGEFVSEWELKDLLFSILNYRIDKQLTTFFSSNFSIEQLKNYYLKKCDSTEAVNRVIDRIYGLSVEVQMKGTNKRRESKW